MTTRTFTIALAAVAILAIAGFIAVRDPAPAVPAPVRVTQPPPHVETAPRATVAAASAALAQAVGAFDRAIEERLDSSPRATTTVTQAGAELEQRASAYATATGMAPASAALDDFTRNARAHRQDGAGLVAGADRRRNLATQYRTTVDAIGARIEASATHGWKIMGRVVTRQSAVELQQALQELRLQSERLLATSAGDPAARDALDQSIDRFAALLAADQANLARTEGQEWMSRMQSDTAQLHALGRQIGALDATRIAQLAAFRSAGFALAAGMPGADAVAVAPAEVPARSAPVAADPDAGRPRLWVGVAALAAVLLVFAAAVAMMLARQRRVRHVTEAHDPLTQLPNRHELLGHLQHAIDRAGSTRQQVAVLLVDLDNFKTINDGMGHGFGDRVLARIAERVAGLAGPAAFVARAGGDEFAVVLDAARTRGVDPAAFGRRLLDSFTEVLQVDDRELSVSVSVGAAVYPDHAASAEGLLGAADAAVFHAKASGRGRVSEFTPHLLEAASARFRIEQGLRSALQRDELELVYQPEVSAETFSVSVLEALLRWRMPDGRLATPGEFMAVAEETGLIHEIGDWVLERAIGTAAAWYRDGQTEVRVAVNVTAPQLLAPGFVERVTGLLARAALPARCIELELTEGALQTGPATIEVLHALRAARIAVALDDFGTGYSSLASLEQLPVSRVKLDKSLIDSIHTNARSRAIMKSIIGLCRKLGLEITAEGIEQADQLALLLPEKAMHLQGFLIARPVAEGEVGVVVARMPLHMAGLLGRRARA